MQDEQVAVETLLDEEPAAVPRAPENGACLTDDPITDRYAGPHLTIRVSAVDRAGDAGVLDGAAVAVSDGCASATAIVCPTDAARLGRPQDRQPDALMATTATAVTPSLAKVANPRGERDEIVDRIVGILM